jgi:hypothetical protein
VVVKKLARKGISKMPNTEQVLFDLLAYDLSEKGPVLPDWPNFSKLGNITYHCHLSRKWVACWRHENDRIEIEVYYAGSRENAPY